MVDAFNSRFERLSLDSGNAFVLQESVVKL